MDREKLVTELQEDFDLLMDDTEPTAEEIKIANDISVVLALLKEQEVENGEWITIWREDDPDTSSHARCSVCNRVSERPLGGYCKWCGAKMNQEWGVYG